ncbi:MAG: TIGR03986 family CRISPR-associated RAMP protein [Deltaproteobacteria bacterium]|nr:TIGR03986 family CRISPR-associated RAMP protein [Deltaproteobacteria bacterium]
MSDLDKIRAPYGFVPLSEHIYFPPWHGYVSQDVPFGDGVCGTLDVEVEALSPIFVRDSKSPDQFFATPDSKFALPGSSVRGALRNVVEIATFGRLGRLNDHRYGVRDLANNELYVQRMSKIEKSKDSHGRSMARPVPLVNAGWMRKATRDEQIRGIAAVIRPVDFAKIEYRKLLDLARTRSVGSFQPGDRQSSVKKYRSWNKELTFRPKVKPIDRTGTFPSRYGEVETLDGGNDVWTLVFTGQPNRWDPSAPPRKGKGAGNPKHHDFAFRASTSATLELEVFAKRVEDDSRATFEDFEFIHADRGQQHRADESPNEEWRFWKERFQAGDLVPVFFLSEQGQVKSFGLAMMFRLAYAHTTRDAVRRRQRSLESKDLDFAETLFGHVRQEKLSKGEKSQGVALKGRLGFEAFVAEGSPKPMGLVTVVLGGPKASYYPNYIEQDPRRPGSPPARVAGKPDYKTLMDEDAVVRGWKRYRPLTSLISPPEPTKGDGSKMSLDRVGSRFRPLPTGTKFVGRIQLHNVKRVELGALLWSLNLGELGAFQPKTSCRHMIGMGRPLGYGSARMTVRTAQLFANDGWRAMDRSELDGCRAEFEELMDSWCREKGEPGGWAASRAIFELRELARPLEAKDGRHMQINHPEYRNEFQQAKLRGLALAAAGDEAEWEAAVKASGFAGATTSAERGPTARKPSATKKAWPGMKGGSMLLVKLTGKSKKDKWMCEAVDYVAKGTISFGDAPESAKEGEVVEVVVQAGGDGMNLGLRWSGK